MMRDIAPNQTAVTIAATPPSISRAAKRGRKSKRPPRAATPLDKAKAVIFMHEQGGLRARPAINPFEGHGGSDTVHNVACGLEYFSQCRFDHAATGMDDDLSYGQFLILQAMVKALETAGNQLDNEHRLAHARETVAAASGKAPAA